MHRVRYSAATGTGAGLKGISRMWGSHDVDYYIWLELRGNMLRNAADQYYPKLGEAIKRQDALMPPTTLHDPVGALIQWLKNDQPAPDNFWPASFDTVPAITYYPQTKEGAPIYEKSPLVIGIKSAGIGSGAGQLAMARYRSIRIDAIASADN